MPAFLPNFSRSGVVVPVEPTEPKLIPDGYGVLFDPIKHNNYMKLGAATQAIATFTDACGTGYIPPDVPLKELPAGHYEKGSGV